MLRHGEACLFVKEDGGGHALFRGSPADLALAKDEGAERSEAAFLLSWRCVKMGKKRGEGLVQQSRGERLKVQPTRVSLSGAEERWRFRGWGGKVAFTGQTAT